MGSVQQNSGRSQDVSESALRNFQNIDIAFSFAPFKTLARLDLEVQYDWPLAAAEKASSIGGQQLGTPPNLIEG